MSRRYRLPVIALVGLTFVIASPPHGEAQTKQSDPKESAGQIEFLVPPVAVEEGKEGPEYYTPCRQKHDDRQSDLCAQWKAADAARDSADWTKISLWVSGAGTVIAFFTLCAAAAAAIFAKHASDHTRDGASQARRSADSAEESLIAAERPWIKVDAKIGKNINFPLDGNGKKQGSVSVDFTLTNFGKSPALNTLIYAKIWPNRWGVTQDLKMEFAGHLSARKEWPKIGFTIFPGDPRTFTHHLTVSPDDIERTRASYRALGAENFIAPDILCCVVYVNPRTNADHETGMVFLIHRDGAGTNLLNINETTRSEEIRVESAIVGGYVT